MINGQVWSSATVPAVARVQVPAPVPPPAGGVRVTTAIRTSVGAAVAESLADVFTTAKIRPCGSPTSCFRLMWSSEVSSPAEASSTRQTVSGSALSWMANRNAPDCWSDHMTPTLGPNAMIADRSSEEMTVSGTAGWYGGIQVLPVSSVEWLTHTREPRVYVIQYLPSAAWSMVADSDEPPL